MNPSRTRKRQGDTTCNYVSIGYRRKARGTRETGETGETREAREAGEAGEAGKAGEAGEARETGEARKKKLLFYLRACACGKKVVNLQRI